MEFSPFNPIVQLCLKGMEKEDQGDMSSASILFNQAWEEAGNDFERFLAAYYISRHQASEESEIHWLELTLDLAIAMNDDSVKSAFPTLYSRLSQSYSIVGNKIKSVYYSEQAIACQYHPSDKGPFYHGTKADLQVGDLLVAGGNSNYRQEFKMNHIYFTAMVNGAGLAAALAKGEGEERVYRIEPTGEFENDPNLTDKKFPGNPTRSYRSEFPLKILEVVSEWVRPNPEDLQKFRAKLEKNNGEIIN